MMTPRLSLFVLAALLFCTAAHSADSKKPTKKSSTKKERTWAKLIDHVMKKGRDWPIEAPSSRTMGFDADSIPAKSLGIDQEKSKDNWEHNVFIVYKMDEKSKPKAKEVILSNIQVIEKDGKQYIDGYDARATLDGKLIGGMRATGIVGKIVQTPLTADSKDLNSFFESERDLYLKKMDWSQLTVE